MLESASDKFETRLPFSLFFLYLFLVSFFFFSLNEVRCSVTRRRIS